MQVSVSITRLQRFLKADELDPNSVERCDKPSSGMIIGRTKSKACFLILCVHFDVDRESAVSVTEGTFNWDGEYPTLTK